jgi:hypothetical protein
LIALTWLFLDIGMQRTSLVVNEIVTSAVLANVNLISHPASPSFLECDALRGDLLLACESSEGGVRLHVFGLYPSTLESRRFFAVLTSSVMAFHLLFTF